MQMVTDLLALCHGLDQLIGQVLRMGSHKTDTLQPFNLFHFFQKFCKGHRCFQSFTVGVYILAKKHDLSNAICDQFLDLADDGLWLAALFAAADIRNDAVAAEVIAAKHYADSCFEGVFAGSWHALYDLIGFLPDINDLVVGLQRPVKKLREFVDIMGSEYKIYIFIILADLFYYVMLLHHTSEQYDLHIRVLPFDAL